jgi:stage IV sporulation protein FB
MLRWRLFGIHFCIQPSFWLMNALWAYILYMPVMRPPQGQLITRDLLIMMLIWVLCMLVTVMVHELGHVITGRIFGQPGNVTLTGLGGQAVGEYGELRPWQRIIVIFAGPGAGFLFVAALTVADGRMWNACMQWLIDNQKTHFWEHLKCNLHLINWIDPRLTVLEPWDPRSQFPIYNLVILLLFIINLFTNIMNLLPIIPMDGGMIFKEICCLIAPRAGLKFAFAWSFLLASGCTIYLLLYVLMEHRFINRIDWVHYPFALPEISLVIFAMMAYQCLQAYRQLAMADRHREYMQDDDLSGSRHGSARVVEVPVKDPDDFAPPAPGSERPRR